MALFVRVSVLFVLINQVHSDTCTQCTETYSSARDGSVANSGKCLALKEYLTCLETTDVDDDGCPLTTHQANQINIDYENIKLECELGSLCKCQLAYWSSNPDSKCSATKTRLSCIRGKMDACNGTVSAADLALTTETIITSTGGCEITDGTSCKCEIDAAKADVDDDVKKCSETMLFINCLKNVDGTLCDNVTVLSEAVTEAESMASGLVDCDITESPCKCDADYAIASIGNDNEKCTALLNYMHCLVGKTGNGCDGSTPLRTLAINTNMSIAHIETCAVSNVCQCQIDFSLASTMDPCSKATKLISCLESITSATEAGCNSDILKETLLSQYKSTIRKTACANKGTVPELSSSVPVLIILTFTSHIFNRR